MYVFKVRQKLKNSQKKSNCILEFSVINRLKLLFYLEKLKKIIPINIVI